MHVFVVGRPGRLKHVAWIGGGFVLRRGCASLIRLCSTGVHAPHADQGRGFASTGTVNLCTKIMDFRGFDSSRILILRCGIPRPIGNSPENLSQKLSRGIGRIKLEVAEWVRWT